MAGKNYVNDIAGGTATVTQQMTATGTLKEWIVNGVSAAAGSYELSLSGTSQIGTAAPDSNVLARYRISGTAGAFAQRIPLPKTPLKILNYFYIHCTGAGNVGTSIVNV
jgi:hypothetical protein